ncbi:MAG: proline dehydrogenase family protein [Crocinitomicaceae bacterium]|nr:proline dehydrogenase family protein [Crocinitomicaceae bacterium]
MISFDNTEIAFAGKSDKDLQWSYRLFKMIGKPWLVKFGDTAQKVAFAIHLPIKGMIKKTIFKQFCGGESINDCDTKISQLGQFNIGTILDYSVEGKESDEDLDHTRDEIIATIHKSRDNNDIPFAVFKPTGICKTDLLAKANKGEDKLSEADKKAYEVVMDRVDAICSAAHEANVPVFIDAEDTWFQDAIDRMADVMMAKYNKEKAIVYNTLQMYRHDRLAFLKESHLKAQETGYILGIKLVRGAYMEKEREKAAEEGYPSPIQPNKEATDTDYNTALAYMCEHVDQIWFCAGTHNERSSQILTELMEEYKIKKGDTRVYFAQLLGMSDHISFNLAHEGYNVAKYVPYGPVKEVMPYLMRRAQENTSVAGQVGRELGLIIKEKERRKNKK